MGTNLAMYAHSLIKSLRQRQQDRLAFLSNKKLYGTSSHLVATALVLFACLAAAVYYAHTIRSSVTQEFNSDAEQVIADTEQAIGARLQVYGNILTGGKGLFDASDTVTRQEWEDFIGAFNVQEQYPGVQGFGYGESVKPGELGTHIQQIRDSGIPEYSIDYTDAEHTYVPIVYVAPFNDSRRTVLGFDMTSEATRRKALESARDSGQLSVTGKVVLIQSKDGGATNQEPGMVIYLPIYKRGAPVATVEERRESIQGYIFASLRINELLRGIFGSEGDNKDVAFQVYDGNQKSEDQLMYRSDNFNEIQGQKGVHLNERTLSIGGQDLVLSYAVSPNLKPTPERNEPLATLVRGVVISLVVAGLIYYLLTNRTRKLMRAQRAEVQSAKDDLLSLASHQLRTPATVVKQYVGMLLQGYGGELSFQQKEMLKNAYVSNERQLQIINQILYVARLDAGQLKLQKERFDIAALLRDIVREHEAAVRDAGQKIIRKIPRKKIEVTGDPQYIYMAIDNLITNASKYTPESGRINVTLDQRDNGVSIRVADTGVGLSEEETKFIFEKFTRGNSEMTAEVSGSGIGLYLVKQIASLHKGKISVEPNEPVGTVFTLFLPGRGVRRSR